MGYSDDRLMILEMTVSDLTSTVGELEEQLCPTNLARLPLRRHEIDASSHHQESFVPKGVPSSSVAVGNEPFIHVLDDEDRDESGVFGGPDEETPVVESIVTSKPKRNVSKLGWLIKDTVLPKAKATAGRVIPIPYPVFIFPLCFYIIEELHGGFLLLIEQKEDERGNEVNAKRIREYINKVESELSSIINDIITVIDEHLIPLSTAGESTVFYYKMKGDYYRYHAQFKSGNERKEFTD
ncbi:hypothetical protein GIB67_023697 [Kingdonia uniflora]|uniref:14-3-3 domain-containing protein n=1 Tax=Kingdonia uniflora TaxID=39325 RepID=A0A7J7MGK3_9MAGN|nr:hypothetical protein GIB67_023697 [Kingdonia uniflora]